MKKLRKQKSRKAKKEVVEGQDESYGLVALLSYLDAVLIGSAPSWADLNQDGPDMATIETVHEDDRSSNGYTDYDPFDGHED